MRMMIACASALVLTAACGSSKDAQAALEAMNLGEPDSGMIQYASKSGSGDKVTLKDAVLGPKGQGLFEAKTVELDGLDLTEDGKPTLSGFVVNDLTLRQMLPGVTFSIDSVAVKGANPATGSFLASTLTSEGPGAPPAFEQWGYSEMSIKGLKVATDFSMLGMGDGSVTMDLGQFSTHDLKDTQIGEAKWAGWKGAFNIPVETGAPFPIVGSYDLGDLSVKGIRAGIFAEAVKAGMESAMDPYGASSVNEKVMAAMTSPIDPGYDSATFSGFNITASGATLAMSDTKATVGRNGDGVVTKVSSPHTTLTFSVDPEAGQIGAMANEFMSKIGYDKLAIYAEAEATYEPEGDVTRYSKYNLGLDDGFDLQLSGGLEGLKSALVSIMNMSDTMAYGGEPDMSGFEKMKIVDLDLTFTDKSITDRLLKLVAEENGQDVEALRSDILAQMSSMSSDMATDGLDPAVSNELVTALSSFIEKPGKLKITLKPATPLAFDGSSEYTKTAMGFSATYEP
ncbi:MAG: hypothetical protein R3C52_14410 [Hyphomonadaceae bacterium]